MALAPLNSQALLARRRQLLDQIRTVTGTQLADVWDSLGGYSDDQQWLARAVPVLVAGQSRAISLTIASLEAILGVQLAFDRPALIDKARIDITQPFISLATALRDGHPFDDAVTAGADRAQTIGETGVTWAARAANGVADSHVTGWERIPEGGACDWCIEVAGQTYHDADSAAFGHDRCACDVVPAA